MKFKAPFIKQAICEIRFNPILSYHQKRFEICEKFKEKLPYWWFDIARIDMYEQKEKEASQRLFTMTCRGASLLFKDVGPYDNFKALSSYLLENVTSGMEINDIIRLGARFFYLSEYENSFNNLKDLLVSKLYMNEFIKNLKIQEKLSDLAYVLDFTQNNTKFHLALGPVSRKEIEERFGGKEKTIDVALIIDLDCFLENVSSTIIKSFLRTSFTDSQAILEKILNILKEE